MAELSFPISGPADPFDGYTFFQDRGQPNSSPFSPGPYSLVVANGTLDPGEITATIHHEIRHLVLGDFGRTIPKGSHSPNFNTTGKPANAVDQQTLDAESEARRNAKEK